MQAARLLSRHAGAHKTSRSAFKLSKRRHMFRDTLHVIARQSQIRNLAWVRNVGPMSKSILGASQGFGVVVMDRDKLGCCQLESGEVVLRTVQEVCIGADMDGAEVRADIPFLNLVAQSVVPMWPLRRAQEV